MAGRSFVYEIFVELGALLVLLSEFRKRKTAVPSPRISSGTKSLGHATLIFNGHFTVLDITFPSAKSRTTSWLFLIYQLHDLAG